MLNHDGQDVDLETNEGTSESSDEYAHLEDQSKLDCKICDKKFHSVYARKRHTKLIHNIPTNSRAKEQNSDHDLTLKRKFDAKNDNLEVHDSMAKRARYQKDYKENNSGM